MKRNKYKIFVLIFVLCITMASISITAADSDNSKAYDFPVTHESKEWKSFQTHVEQIEASKVPKDKILSMKTEHLIQTVLDYPLLVDMYFYDTFEEGIKAVSAYFDGLTELMERQDATTKMLEVYDRMKESTSSDDFKLISLNILIGQVNLKNAEKISATEAIAVINATVNTPNGTPVYVFMRGEELTTDQRISLDNQTKNTFPNATYISSSTTNYNCHSYAWHSTSITNKYWMDYPDAYMEDGSYDQYTGSLINVAPGYRMFYDYGAHSAIVYAYPGPVSGAGKIKVTSKWGKGPVMRHQADYSPYTCINPTIWD